MTVKERVEEKRKQEKKPWITGLLVVAVFIGGFCWAFLGKSEKNEIKQKTKAIAVVNIDAVMKAHSSHEKLKALEKEREELLKDLEKEENIGLNLIAPKARREVFENAAGQKIKQKKIAEHGKMISELKKAEKEKRQELLAEWQKERKEVNETYLNAILNIRLKLENADLMRLSADAIKTLEQSMSQLQYERGLKQQEIDEKYEQKIYDSIAKLAEEKGMNVQQVMAHFSDEARAKELKKQTLAQRRNAEEIQKKLVKSVEHQARLLEKTVAFKAKCAEITALEGQMLYEIASKASKLSVMYDLTAIMAMTEVNDKKEYPTVINVGAKDLTKELVKEITKK